MLQLSERRRICIFFFGGGEGGLGGLDCVGQTFVYVAHFVLLRDVWIRTQRASEGEGVEHKYDDSKESVGLFQIYSLFAYWKKKQTTFKSTVILFYL